MWAIFKMALKKPLLHFPCGAKTKTLLPGLKCACIGFKFCILHDSDTHGNDSAWFQKFCILSSCLAELSWNKLPELPHRWNPCKSMCSEMAIVGILRSKFLLCVSPGSIWLIHDDWQNLGLSLGQCGPSSKWLWRSHCCIVSVRPKPRLSFRDWNVLALVSNFASCMTLTPMGMIQPDFRNFASCLHVLPNCHETSSVGCLTGEIHVNQCALRWPLLAFSTQNFDYVFLQVLFDWFMMIGKTLDSVLVNVGHHQNGF